MTDPLAMWCRIMVVGGVLTVLALLPLWKLVEVQAGDASALVEQGQHQRLHTMDVVPQRGSILDRNGTELAISLPRRSVGIELPTLRLEGIETPVDLDRFARRLADLFDVDADRLAARLVAADPEARWVQVADQVDVDVAERAIERIEGEGIVGAVVTGESTERVHPAGESALRIIGTLTPDGPGDRAGIERAYDEELSGRKGRRSVELGRLGGTVPGTERVITEPVPGSDVMLTIDRTLQHEVEQILLRRTDEAGARSGVAIVGRPGSGELLAVGSVERSPESGALRLSAGPTAFADVFQAGSVFKLVTVAAAVEAGLVDAEHSIEVPHRLQVDDWTFEDHEEHPTEQMTVTRIVAESSNVGTIKIAQALGKEGLHDALVGFGFGRRTGVGHPAEDAGILPPVDGWGASDLAAASIGTHQSGTALQLWAAYNVIANGGRYVQPRLVDSVIHPDGTRRPVPAAPARTVISPDTARQVGSMLEEVVRDGTGSLWNLPGYSVAAKTGTSRMVADTAGGEDGYTWSDGRRHYVAAFTGYLPADRPEVSITVILEDVSYGLTGSTAAGPVFSDLAKLSIRELGIAPSHLAGTGVADGEQADRRLVRAAPAGRPAGRADGGSGSASEQAGATGG
jgi:cell division protein FtsI (penicillin-binding protein 3)